MAVPSSPASASSAALPSPSGAGARLFRTTSPPACAGPRTARRGQPPARRAPGAAHHARRARRRLGHARRQQQHRPRWRQPQLLWFVYPEAGTLKEPLNLGTENLARIRFQVPEVSAPATAHVIPAGQRQGQPGAHALPARGAHHHAALKAWHTRQRKAALERQRLGAGLQGLGAASVGRREGAGARPRPETRAAGHARPGEPCLPQRRWRRRRPARHAPRPSARGPSAGERAGVGSARSWLCRRLRLAGDSASAKRSAHRVSAQIQ